MSKINWKLVIPTPGAVATVDDQGKTDLCTSFAMAKVVVDESVIRGESAPILIYQNQDKKANSSE